MIFFPSSFKFSFISLQSTVYTPVSCVRCQDDDKRAIYIILEFVIPNRDRCNRFRVIVVMIRNAHTLQ